MYILNIYALSETDRHSWMDWCTTTHRRQSSLSTWFHLIKTPEILCPPRVLSTHPPQAIRLHSPIQTLPIHYTVESSLFITYNGYSHDICCHPCWWNACECPTCTLLLIHCVIHSFTCVSRIDHHSLSDITD